jgi:hypothetical protein
MDEDLEAMSREDLEAEARRLRGVLRELGGEFAELADPEEAP